MHFTKIKITGFKSFVEPTEVVVEAGLTGIVGPNGCGKSNVVESLRWAMGENSARRLRGGDMDDVIFAGSAGRPARNIAEVSIILDNAQRTALAEFNNDDAVEVTRRIERGMGSDYRINGKPVRQKDVQLLFADQATGAHSTSIVSQGRISALIQAKPQERRQVLEEAAGISGLHARRHEAELKLKAAEGNMTRAADQLQALENQIKSLKTQVRQASRYRNLGELIGKAEGGLLYLKAKQAEVNLRLMEDNFSESEGTVRDLTSAVTLATTALAEASAVLPSLRQNEAAKAAILQRLHLEAESLARDIARLETERAAVAERLQHAASDHAREESLAVDAQTAITRLAEEAETLQQRLEHLATSKPALQQAVDEATAKVASVEQGLQEKTESLARVREQQAAFDRQKNAIAERQRQLTARAADAARQIGELEQAIAVLPSLSLARSMVEACETDLARKQELAATAHEKRGISEQELASARDAAQKADVEKAALQAEAGALTKLLQLDDSTGTPLSDRIMVEPGYEAALAAALSDALLAPLASSDENGAKIFWQDLGAFNGGTEGFASDIENLSRYVNAPDALARSLSQIGLVADDAAGERLASSLKPGQILVTRQGAAWRWDGYTQRAEAITPAAARLQQRNRLAELEALITFAAEKAETAAAARTEKTAEADAARKADQESQTALQQAFTALDSARRHLANETEAQAGKQAQLERLRETSAVLAADIATVETEATQLNSLYANLPDADALNNAVQEMRITLADERRQLNEAAGALSGHERDIRTTQTRFDDAGRENGLWRTRAEAVETRMKELMQRTDQLMQEAETLAAKPAELEGQRAQLLDQKQQADAERKEAADQLQQAETTASSLERDMRKKEEALMQAKENRVRAEAQMGHARLQHEELETKIRDQWHCAPDSLLEKIGTEDANALPSLEQLEHDFARFTKERENMGPVNLRAEIEAEELQQQIDKMLSEREELESAIAKLRQGINTLNKEARERLQTAFDDVNKNFGELFTRLFGGGKAHLQLIESDDPLDAGLEIFASPPGKRLQALSLLSGGEQALTALSLLFAIFLVNPSPICVLDEVDAPLDEANVGRYCDILRDMAEQGRTRFLIITHHRLTMARMDRLYGVTMAEKGVSQLVSVDLKQALAMRENPAAIPHSGTIEAAA